MPQCAGLGHVRMGRISSGVNPQRTCVRGRSGFPQGIPGSRLVRADGVDPVVHALSVTIPLPYALGTG